MYLIPTSDIASAELLKQFRARGIDIDRVAMAKARQDGKMMDKTSNTKCIAQVIAQQMQAWISLKATDPDSQQEIIQLRQQVAELRQRVGEHTAEVNPSSTPAPGSSSAQLSPIQRSLQGASAPPAPPSFEPTCSLPFQATPTLGWQPIFQPAWQTAPSPTGSTNSIYPKPRRTRFKRIWRRPKHGCPNNQPAQWTPFRKWPS